MGVPVYVDVAGVEDLAPCDGGLPEALGRPLQHVERVPVPDQHALTP